MAVVGYASVTSVRAGEEIDLHLSSDASGPVSLRVERVGAAFLGVAVSTTVQAQAVPTSRPWEGFGWPVTTTFPVPSSWPSGLYAVRSPDGDVLSFVVRTSSAASGSGVLVHIPYLTHAAYNAAGGKSLYGFNSGGEAERAQNVSMHRTWDNGAPGLGLEASLIRWLESEGLAVDCCSSTDLHDDHALLTSYDCLILAGHDEYWTRQMRDQVEHFVGTGGNMVVLSGNTCYRAVRFEAATQSVVFYKYAASDPAISHEDVTVAWAEPPLNRPQNTMIGVGFTEGAFGGPSTPYRIRFPRHWVFEGLSHPISTSAFMHYETDAAAYVDEPEGYPRVAGDEGSPRCFTVLADADLRSWSGKPGRATMGVFSRNGTVFNAATTDWIEALGTDPVVTGVTRNVLRRLRQRPSRDWELVGHANRAHAMTSLDAKLFLATGDNRLWRRHPVGADVPWRQIGHANDVVAMAGSGDTLYCVTADNRLWWRPPLENDVDWTAIGTGPAGGTTSLAAAGGLLYATTPTGALHRTPAQRGAASWYEMTFFASDPTVTAMASYSDILFASTADNRLLRSNTDWINESSGWSAIHHCNFSAGLAIVEWMLFVATTENLLWRLDIYGLRHP